MLTPVQEPRALFERLEEHDVKALVALGLVGKFTTENELKFLSLAMRLDDAIRLPRASMWIAAQDVAREAGDAEWYEIADTDFTSLDVVMQMTESERAALRARLR